VVERAKAPVDIPVHATVFLRKALEPATSGKLLLSTSSNVVRNNGTLA
jgi:hypothetical protein